MVTVPATTALPRLVIAAPASGHGKTTVATGLMAALRTEGLEVAGFKVGPDYIDPGYHALATGRPGRNLDPHLCSEELLVPLLLHGATTPVPADVAVVEGVMGLFDGRIGGDGFASTAHVAGLIGAPVVVIMDVSSMSRTAAALAQGLITFEPSLRIGGVIMNKVGSVRHAREVRTAMEDRGITVFGALPRDGGIEAPSRHLGLVPAAERGDAEAAVARLGRRIAEQVALTDLLALAYAAPPLVGQPWSPTSVVRPPSGQRPVVAVAGGRAFTFAYAETAELLRAGGCEPVTFDPTSDEDLPAGTAGLYLGGGFPEVHAAELSANHVLRSRIRTAIGAGLPTVAECAGLIYLCRSVDGQPMVGAVDAEATMTPRLTLGYRTAVVEKDQLLAVAGRRVTGHEFHKTTVEPGAGPEPAWLVEGSPAGFARANLHASYLHVHWAGHPHLAQRFCDAVHAFASRVADGPRERIEQHDLGHHGDAEVAEGLVDLAVNVRVPRPPAWLAEVIAGTVDDLAAYPSTGRAIAAIAALHDVSAAAVLPTAGAAEAFTLLARARAWRHPVVIHPQFTEPEATLLAAGRTVERVLLDAADGFVLDPERVPAAADLVVVGNPTNPTSVLHPAARLRELVRSGRTLVVDEAFMDAVPGETETLIGEVGGVVVLRSLTKTWGLAGLRTGYAVGDPELIAAMGTQQPSWSVSTPALAAIEACLSPEARVLAAAAAVELGERRELLVAELRALGLQVSGAPTAPFVLLDTRDWIAGRPSGWLRLAIREQGFAVRRGETFPGLDPDWVRVAVRDPETTRALAKALRVIRDSA